MKPEVQLTATLCPVSNHSVMFVKVSVDAASSTLKTGMSNERLTTCDVINCVRRV